MPATQNVSPVRACFAQIYEMARTAFNATPAAKLTASERRAFVAIIGATEAFSNKVPSEREPYAVCRDCGAETELDPMPLVAVCHACTSRQLRLAKEA